MEEDGIVGKATWYRIKQIYNGVKKLSELDSEGIRPEELEPVVLTDLIPGTYSNEMKTVQYYLAVIGYFISGLPEVEIDGYYGPETEEAIRQFQNYYGLPVTGRVDRETWNRILRVYSEINASIPDTYYQGAGILFPGFMQLGMEGGWGKGTATISDQNFRHLSGYSRNAGNRIFWTVDIGRGQCFSTAFWSAGYWNCRPSDLGCPGAGI